jgi:diguanylate cyclase
MALDTRLAHAELTELRERTAEKQAEMTRLQKELDQASAQARHDPLTGSLNRKGLDEVMEREIARARRSDTPLCVALLDVDNFKQLNDRLGLIPATPPWCTWPTWYALSCARKTSWRAMGARSL